MTRPPSTRIGPVRFDAAAAGISFLRAACRDLVTACDALGMTESAERFRAELAEPVR